MAKGQLACPVRPAVAACMPTPCCHGDASHCLRGSPRPRTAVTFLHYRQSRPAAGKFVGRVKGEGAKGAWRGVSLWTGAGFVSNVKRSQEPTARLRSLAVGQTRSLEGHGSTRIHGGIGQPCKTRPLVPRMCWDGTEAQAALEGNKTPSLTFTITVTVN